MTREQKKAIRRERNRALENKIKTAIVEKIKELTGKELGISDLEVHRVFQILQHPMCTSVTQAVKSFYSILESKDGDIRKVIFK